MQEKYLNIKNKSENLDLNSNEPTDDLSKRLSSIEKRLEYRIEVSTQYGVFRHQANEVNIANIQSFNVM